MVTQVLQSYVKNDTECGVTECRQSHLYYVFTRSASESLFPVSRLKRVTFTRVYVHAHKFQFYFSSEKYIYIFCYSPRRLLIGGKNSAHVVHSVLYTSLMDMQYILRCVIYIMRNKQVTQKFNF